MQRISILLIAAGTVFLLPATARAKVICTMVVDAADGQTLLEEGDCRTRVTPASTFKVPLALMGFDSGFLKDAHAPLLPFKPGYPDWGGENWRQPTDPARWLKYSVVWYSQRVTHALGQARVEDYARKFGFGNADLSGDPGKANGLDRAWIASSLMVSPAEEAAFLRKLITRHLPVSEHAFAETEKVVEISPAAEGWQLHGKTGTAYPRDAAGAADDAHGYGWYVGWSDKGDRTFVFVRLDQDERVDAVPTGLRTRAAWLAAWPEIARILSRPQP